MEIGRREAEARSQVKMPDPDGDPAIVTGYGGLAEELKEKVGGQGKDAYDFSKTEDILRFKNDVAQLNQDLVDGETAYAAIVDKQKELEDNRNLFVNGGKNLRKISSQEVEGVGSVYDAHLLDDQYQGVMNDMDALRTAKISHESLDTISQFSNQEDLPFDYEGDGGAGKKFVARDSKGNVIAAFDSMEDYLSTLNKKVAPDLTPVPPVTGQEFIRENNWGTLYDTEKKAEGAALAYVLNNPEEAKAAYLDRRGLKGQNFRDMPSDEGSAIMQRHQGEEDIDKFDNLSVAQYEYMQEMMEEWTREQQKKTITKKDGTKVKAGSATDLLNTTVTRRSNATFSEFDLTGAGAGGVNPAGTTSDMTQIVLDTPLDARIEYVDNGATESQHTVEVSSIGYDGENLFGVGSFKDPDTKEEFSVKVPLPMIPSESAPGDLVGVLMQQFDMNESEYEQLVGNLVRAF